LIPGFLVCGIKPANLNGHLDGFLFSLP